MAGNRFTLMLNTRSCSCKTRYSTQLEIISSPTSIYALHTRQFTIEHSQTSDPITSKMTVSWLV